MKQAITNVQVFSTMTLKQGVGKTVQKLAAGEELDEALASWLR